jgi:hypothetical protein
VRLCKGLVDGGDDGSSISEAVFAQGRRGTGGGRGPLGLTDSEVRGRGRYVGAGGVVITDTEESVSDVVEFCLFMGGGAREGRGGNTGAFVVNDGGGGGGRRVGKGGRREVSFMPTLASLDGATGRGVIGELAVDRIETLR